jgi:transcriptional regulator with GAF, ATPase, and Fis domain
MTSALTQTTQQDSWKLTGAPESLAALRWVFPLPPLPTVLLEEGKISLGRDPQCDVVLASGRVSRRHAQLSRSGPLWLLNDLDSKNGVSVNGRRAQSAALSPGDVIRIGDFVAVFMQATRSSDLSFAEVAPGIFGGVAHRGAAEEARRAAASNICIVLEGATGTGKERFAEAIHVWSGRSGRFLGVNCAVYSKAVAAGELFGYRKGAFTGAEQASAGHLRAAQRGTLLLDELIELPLDVQAMLLRAIETREVLPLGETSATPIDVRFISACQVPLASAVQDGRVRADLRARLEGTVIRLPSLSECKEIIPELFCALFERKTGKAPRLSANFAEQLSLCDWPLNVRELDTFAQRSALLSTSGDLHDAEPLRAWCADGGRRESSAPSEVPVGPAVPGRKASEAFYPEQDLRQLVAALAKCKGNVSKAAASLALSRQRAYRMLEAATRAGLID